jgi:hypothetical protein
MHLKSHMPQYRYSGVEWRCKAKHNFAILKNACQKWKKEMKV